MMLPCFMMKTNPQKKKGRVGSSFDGFLAEEDILEICEEQALRQIIEDQLAVAVGRQLRLELV